MPKLSKQAHRNFDSLFQSLRQARRDVDKAIMAAEDRGDDAAVKDGIALDLKLEQQLRDLIELERRYVASQLGPSQAEAELKRVVNRTRKAVRSFKTLAEGLEKMAKVIDMISKFAKFLA